VSSRRLWPLVLLCAVACNRTPPNQAPPSGDGGQTITGREQLGWDQAAVDAIELGAFHYALYIDNARFELASACNTAPPTGPYSCSAPLPHMDPGSHTLQMATFLTIDGQIVESAKTDPLRVTVSGSATPPSQAEQPGTALVPGQGTVDGASPIAVALIRELDAAVTDLAVAPDGHVFAGDAAGHVHAIALDAAEPPVLGTAVNGQVISIALDPRFSETHAVFVLSAQAAAGGSASFAIARFREVAGTLGDRVPLLDEVPASAQPHGALRFGPDGNLYAAFDDGGDAGAQGDLASPNGKILRLTRDGATPRDQPGGSPVYAYPFAAPTALAWEQKAAGLWTVDAAGVPRIALLREPDPAVRRAAPVRAIALPPGADPGTAVLYGRDELPAFSGALLLAAGRQGLVRVRASASDPSAAPAIDRVLGDRLAVVSAIAAGFDGALLVAGGSSVGRLAPVPTPSRR